ncbi:hypothetical protein MCUN1_001542 [Malassezia cuniculi]|uniref:SET domain-containing protein n=1 Tax=Malassezia cuniculi TaxID=948313 RepID=A0AAF0EPY5_9BASI|nr:hypothetical protein MCUN1_001542 [Malassezia cuniculi]
MSFADLKRQRNARANLCAGDTIFALESQASVLSASQSMQSHYGDFEGDQKDKAAQTAYRLARYIWGDGESEAVQVSELIRSVMRHNTNAFALSDPQLDPIGVCISAHGALLNHTCVPNAVVVFPTDGSNAPPTRCKLHVIALRDIEPDREVLISYVDIAETTVQRQLYDRLQQAQTLAKKVTDHDHANALPSAQDYRILRETVQWTSSFFPPSNTLSWMLMYAAHVQAIERAEKSTDAAALWDDATTLAFLLCAGMQARGVAADERSSIYPPGHPIRAVLLATLGKLLAHEPGVPPAQSPVAERAISVPQLRGPRLEIARGALVQALGEARIGFGSSSQVAEVVRETLQAIDIERAL